MKIVIAGAGAWGTSLAISACHAPLVHQVSLWGRDAAQTDAMRRTRCNVRYLNGCELPENLVIADGDLGALAAGADLAIVATPMAALRPTLQILANVHLPVAWLCKGFEQTSHLDLERPGLLPHEVAADVAPKMKVAALSGPSFAREVALGQPTALVAASTCAALRLALVDAFHGPHLRVYATDDIAGVEVGGAVKNVLAIATGLCDGLNLGLNARAALITRGLAEMTRLGIALGARAETFMGLSGLGDLVLTATGDLSRNRQVGLALAAGQTLSEAVDSLGHVAEGVYSARTVVRRAQFLKVSMPIAEAVLALLEGRMQPHQAVAALMGRDPRGEGLEQY